jgi:Ca2+-binding RTX toxin-like protein
LAAVAAATSVAALTPTAVSQAEEVHAQAVAATCDGRPVTFPSNPAPVGETIVGTDRDEVFNGGSGPDRIRGGGGDDVICGGSGRDELFGGAGNDEVFGNRGDDEVHGNRGGDTLRGGRALDRANGGAGNADICAAEKEINCE